MRINIPIALILCLLGISVSGQSKKSFDKLISSTNDYLEEYAKLHPWNGENSYSFKASGLPEKQLNKIKKYPAGTDGYTKDSISEYSLITEFQDLIMGNLERIVSHDKFTDNNIKDLISNDYDLYIAVSEDNKLYNFALNEKTGGTYRSQISMMHYTGFNQENMLSKKEHEEEINIGHYTVFEGDGFDYIYTLDTEEGTKYVLTGSVRGCSYCFETHVMMVKFESGSFLNEFAYSINSRSWEDGVTYNPQSKSITVDYVTDDLTPECNCTNTADLHAESDYYSDNDENEPVVKRCHCTFEFNGNNFELVRESWEKINEEEKE